MKRIAVVVPTRDRPDALVHCLDALDALSNRHEVEVVVVDDGSRDEARVAGVVAAHPDVRVVRTTGLGIGGARNAGAAAATARVVLFTDDDCRADPEWAALLADAIEQEGVGAAGGETRPGDPKNTYAPVSEAVCAFARDELGFLVGNNFGCRREILLDVPFVEGTPVPAAEDREWSQRVAAAGHELRHEPRAIVFHDRPLDLRRFWAQHVHYGRGAAWLAHYAPVPRPWRFYVALVADGFRRGPRHGALTCLAQVATVVGYVAERRKHVA
jgi:GT2 family glycosyltransferase